MRLLSREILVIAEQKLEMENFPPVISVVTLEGTLWKRISRLFAKVIKLSFPTLHARLISPWTFLGLREYGNEDCDEHLMLIRFPPLCREKIWHSKWVFIKTLSEPFQPSITRLMGNLNNSSIGAVISDGNTRKRWTRINYLSGSCFEWIPARVV